MNLNTKESSFSKYSCYLDNIFFQNCEHGSGDADRGACEAVQQGLCPPHQAVHKAQPQGVPEDCNGHSRRVRHHGIYWLHRQAHSHSYQ